MYYWVGMTPPDWTHVQTNSGPSYPLWLTNAYGGTNPMWSAVDFGWAAQQFEISPPEEYDFTWTINGRRGTVHTTTNFFHLQIIRPLTNVLTMTSSSPTNEVSSNLLSWLPVSTNYVRLTNPLGNWFYRGTNVHIARTNL